jgi:hypothetical protein
MKNLLITLLILTATPAVLASTGPVGFSTGFATGMTGVDFSDGTNRYNIGGVNLLLNFGLHIQDFAFLFEGSFLDFKGSLNDYVSDGGFKIKWYFTDNWHLSYVMGLSRFQVSDLSGPITTITAYGGGYAGGVLGFDVVGGDTNTPFRLSINSGVRHYDFGSTNVTQGQNSGNQDLVNHLNGVSWFAYLGLDWYL